MSNYSKNWTELMQSYLDQSCIEPQECLKFGYIFFIFCSTGFVFLFYLLQTIAPWPVSLIIDKYRSKWYMRHKEELAGIQTTKQNIKRETERLNKDIEARDGRRLRIESLQMQEDMLVKSLKLKQLARVRAQEEEARRQAEEEEEEYEALQMKKTATRAAAAKKAAATVTRKQPARRSTRK
ncbi:hypothetical protein CDD82_2728 [Ophiocordyceps australis]|uniref:Uncharacterized protein n=1 Tax=Ophiocordyceps australis TaxID=1399860 RepID=A0A2C5ZAT6_9HYPO|nr:hypothetical protein CDD82_2728 [Ophiocordyceps australis]